MPERPDSPRSLAERVYAGALEADGEVDVGALCQAHPELASDLRRLHEEYERVRGVVETLAPSGSKPLAERIRSRHGSRPELEVSLEPEGEPDDEFSAEVLEKLADRHDFGRYKVKGEVARGGQGAILRVWDADLRRTLAMKITLERRHGPGDGSSAGNSRTLGRFLEEAQVTGQLDHPGIVPVHELGLDSDGHVYFTMRLVKGFSLERVFAMVTTGEDGWNDMRALGVILKVCEALSYAHSKRVIHRDLKPANIMVGRFGEAYVMDWGLARVQGIHETKDIRPRTDSTLSLSQVRSDRREHADEAADSPLVTMDGDVLGTPAYMSPEQARGDLEAMGPASDVYSMGAILYQLLAGHMPFVPPETQLNAYAVWGLVQQGPPAPITQVAKDAPAELVAICEKAMAREPAERYADMLELAKDLRAFLEHRVVSAYETGAWAEARKWIERNRALATALAAAVLLLVGGLVTSLVFKRRADEQAEIAFVKERLANERADDVLRLSALQDVDDLLAEVDELWPAVPENAARFESWIERARDCLAQLPLHREKRDGLRARALPRSEENREAERRGHPSHPELMRLEGEIACLLRARAHRRGGEVAPLPELDAGALPAHAAGLNELAWERVDPARERFGDEPLGLALALRALERAEGDDELVDVGDTVAWAYFALGRDEDALDAMFAAVDGAPPSRRGDQERRLAELEDAVNEATSEDGLASVEAALAELEARRAELAARVDERREWYFPESEPEARWWNNQLTKLIASLEELEAGPLAEDGVSERFGWSVPKRLAFARRLETTFGIGGEYERLWLEVKRELQAAYPGLDVPPQRGLVPLGPDPASGLWEFAVLATGLVPERDERGELVVTADTGLVLVLLPGGTFSMGAQATAASEANHDPQAQFHEGPVHAVRLSPFFLSKFELTQGQWQRLAGGNPSYYQPPDGLAPTLLHPLEQVSWRAGREACERLGLSLPTEAQWEYAARGGTSTPWWTGARRESLVGAANLADQAARRSDATWSAIDDWPELDDGYAAHAPVDRYAANPFGLHNVHGNVWEWCRDAYDEGVYGRSASEDPVAELAGSTTRVIRGGGFINMAANTRSAARFAHQLDDSGRALGLRPARALDRRR